MCFFYPGPLKERKSRKKKGGIIKAEETEEGGKGKEGKGKGGTLTSPGYPLWRFFNRNR